MTPQTKECKNCQSKFAIEEDDTKFYEKLKVTPPTQCWNCRQQRRLAVRNDIALYQRKCDATKEDIISMYSPDSEYTVYEQEYWWSDKWNAKDYAKDYDPTKSFFEQFDALKKEVPRNSLISIAGENSHYANYALRNKNCYLIHTADHNEDSFYLRPADRNFNCCDCAYTYDSTQCYECTDCHGCTRCKYSQKIQNSSELLFCYNTKSCHDCIFCANISNKQYWIFNKQHSQEEYEKFKAELKLDSHSGVQNAWEKYQDFLKDQPRKHLETIKCEDSIGDYLKNCKNAKYCFDCYDLHDVKYGCNIFKVKDSYDWNFIGNGELCYEMSSSAHELFNCRFSSNCWDGNKDITYCDFCLGCEKCFGCVGMRKAKYCIFNKKYEQEEYEKLVPQIIEKMKEDGEWGEFPPISISPFAYNETVAQEYFPLTKEQAVEKGYKWKDKDKKDYKPQSKETPDAIKDVPENFTEELLACESCGKNFKLVEQELKYYKEFGIPVPHKCFNCRHAARESLRNKRIIYKQACDKCETQVQTSYTPESEAPVYCEKCYLETLN